MKLTFIHKDGGSNTGDCAALIATDTAPAGYKLAGGPGYILQGVTLTADELAALAHATAAGDANLGAGESAVWVPANVIDRLQEGT